MNLTIFQLKELLEDAINEKMTEFHTLSNKAKRMVHNIEPRAKIDRVYFKMAKIAYELQPVEEIIRISNPTYPKFFAGLLDYYEKKHPRKETKKDNSCTK